MHAYFFSGEPNPNPTLLQRAHPQSLSFPTTPLEIILLDNSVGLKMNGHGGGGNDNGMREMGVRCLVT